MQKFFDTLARFTEEPFIFVEFFAERQQAGEITAERHAVDHAHGAEVIQNELDARLLAHLQRRGTVFKIFWRPSLVSDLFALLEGSNAAFSFIQIN